MTAAIEVLEVRRLDGHGNLKAFAKVKIGCIVIHGCRIEQQARRPGSPCGATGAPEGGRLQSGWFPVVEITSRSVLDQLRRRRARGLGTRAGSVTAPRAADARASDLGPIPRPRRRAVSADLSTFLERFRPDGYTCFVGIVPDGTTVAESFNGADTSQAETWIRSQNRARNCYFTANATPPDLRRKPAKEGCH